MFRESFDVVTFPPRIIEQSDRVRPRSASGMSLIRADSLMDQIDSKRDVRYGRSVICQRIVGVYCNKLLSLQYKDKH